MSWSLTKKKNPYPYPYCLARHLNFFFIFYFCLYIYPSDSQESDGAANTWVGNYPDLLPEITRYYCPLAFNRDMTVINLNEEDFKLLLLINI